MGIKGDLVHQVVEKIVNCRKAKVALSNSLELVVIVDSQPGSQHIRSSEEGTCRFCFPRAQQIYRTYGASFFCHLLCLSEN